MTDTPAALLARMGEPLDEAGYDWGRAGATPVDAETLFQLVYAAQVEWATEGTFESLDITDDPLVKRFLRIWREQEIVHGRLLARFVALKGYAAPPLHRTARQRFAARRGKWVNALVHRIVGDDFFAVHMTWGAVNELMTLRFYALMRTATRNPVLRDLLRDVIAQETLHYRFYRSVAAARLHGNARAQRLTRWSLTHLWSPVGTGLRGRADGDRLVAGIVGPYPDEVLRLDRTLESLPGLAGLGLVSGAVASAHTRLAPTA